jgi:predicted RNA-binding Zn-ribbon protein involved in translation (DUF1610 family)
MTDEQINDAIAKACGWTQHIVSKEDPFTCVNCGASYSRSIWREWEIPYQWCEKDGKDRKPDYANDLNAMHEAENLCIVGQHDMEYREALGDICGQYQIIWHATSRQRAEAFLKTLNLWTE